MRRQSNRMDRLPGNAKTKPKTQVDIRGEVRMGRKKEGLAHHIKNIGNGLFAEVIWPAIQNMIYDFLSQGGRMLIFGEGGREHRSYNSRYRKLEQSYLEPKRVRRTTGPTRIHREMSTSDVVDDIFFDYRESAEDVLERLHQYIEQYGNATVGDLRSAVGFSTTVSHQRYGWTSLRGTRILSTTDGYLIDFPPVEYFN